MSEHKVRFVFVLNSAAGCSGRLHSIVGLGLGCLMTPGLSKDIGWHV